MVPSPPKAGAFRRPDDDVSLMFRYMFSMVWMVQKFDKLPAEFRYIPPELPTGPSKNESLEGEESHWTIYLDFCMSQLLVLQEGWV